MLMSGTQQAGFRRVSVIRFDLKSVTDGGAPASITLSPQKLPEAGMKLHLYGIRDGSDADKRPSDGGWTEGSMKKGEATEPAVITWDRMEALLGANMESAQISSEDVELITTTEPSGNGALVIEGDAIREFIGKDSNQLVSFILVAEDGSVVAKTKEWHKYQAPTLNLGE
jgi:hypothetical protein